MSEEEAIKLLKYKILMFNNDVYLGDCLDKQNIEAIKVSLNYIEQLQKENKELKEKLDISEANYDIIYDYFSQANKILGTELCEEAIEEILKLKRNNNILTEFEKWLKKSIVKLYNKIYVLENNKLSDCAEYLTLMSCLDKLQELKEDKKNEKSND